MQTFGAHVTEAEVSRSYLFVPADSEKKLAKACASGADALIIDLEDAVAADARPAARKNAAAFLAEGNPPDCWVRINPLDSPDALDDLNAVMPARPRGIVLPKPYGASDVRELAGLLDALEQEHGLEPGATRILPIVTERPAALFRLHEYHDASPRVAALTWGAEDLAAALGASASRGTDDRWLAPYELARSLCLFAAATASVPAVDTVYTEFRNADGLADYAATARRDGFEGMLAIHPNQVGIINETFVPSAEEIEQAQQVVALFAANPDAGALTLGGRMIDRPHWVQAKRILETAARFRQ